MKWFAKSCSLKQMSLLATGVLTGAEKLEAERHATFCPNCRGLLAELTASVVELRRAKHRAAEIEPSRLFHNRWTGAIKSTKRSHHRFLSQSWNVLSQLILPRPTAWASLGALWMAIIYFHVSCPKTGVKIASSTAMNQTIASYAEQRRELARVLEFSSREFHAEREPAPQSPLPVTAPATRPRTQRQTQTMLG